MHRLYLSTHVREALAVDPRVAAQDLHIDVRHGVVHIGGEVATPDIRGAIDDILAALPGVAQFENHTKIRTLANPVHERVEHP